MGNIQSTNLRPLRDRVIVKIIEHKSDSPIVLIRDVRVEFMTGLVLAVGPKVTEVQVGQVVAFSNFNGSDLPEFSTDGAKLRTLIESDIAFEVEDGAQVE